MQANPAPGPLDPSRTLKWKAPEIFSQVVPLVPRLSQLRLDLDTPKWRVVGSNKNTLSWTVIGLVFELAGWVVPRRTVPVTAIEALENKEECKVVCWIVGDVEAGRDDCALTI